MSEEGLFLNLIELVMIIAAFVMLCVITARLGRIRKEAIDTTECLVKCWHQLNGIRVHITGESRNPPS